HRTAPGDGHGDGSLVGTPLSADPFWFVTDRLAPPPATSEMFLNTLILNRIRLHRATFSTKPEGARVCLPCHVQTLTALPEGRMSHATQDQYAPGPASGFAAEGRECASCHMPRYISKGSYLVVAPRLRAASTYVTAVAAGQKGLEEVVAALHGRSSLPPP